MLNLTFEVQFDSENRITVEIFGIDRTKTFEKL